uniref:Variant surface glycoprotein 1125.186 n=1 Tax=Trypanosoma brucei TaxID=5691 RepID=A0A1J0R5C7_9TRYP|nr:variant surface glycoprotein 1125.186 [Trypanosoma brucei]
MQAIQDSTIKMCKQLMLLLILCSIPPSGANVGEADNLAVFAAVCELFQIAEGELPPDEQVTDSANAVRHLEALNMSVAEDKWRQQFYKGNYEKRSWQEAKDAGLSPHESWKTKWERWQQTAIKNTPEAEPGKTGEERNFNELTEISKKSVQAKVAALLAKVGHLEAERSTAEQEIISGSNAELSKKLNKALYGVETGRGDFGKTAGATGAATTLDACNTAGTIDGQQPLAYVMMCLCLETGSTKTGKICAKDHALTKAWNDANPNVNQAFDDVRNLCPSGKKTAITAYQIRKGLSAAQAFIRMHSGTGYLGGFNSGSCNGAVANGICVKYDHKITAGANGFTELTYAANMLEAASLLENRQHAVQKANQLAHAINAEASAAWLISKEVEALQKLERAAAAQVPTTSQAPGTSKQPSVEEQNKCKNATNKTAEGCSAINCDFDNEKKECKPKDGEGQTNTAVGTNSEGKKCSDKKTEGECKDGCKWKNNACKDSSILANKQLDLMLSAAFVALLF